MKRSILLTLALLCTLQIECRSLVGQKAPAFKAQAIANGVSKSISLDDYAGKNKILVFYPADFSFICPTELFALQDKLSDFKKRNAEIIAISVDPLEKHKKWLETARTEGGIKGVTYPIISDADKTITRAYDVLDSLDGNVAFRGIFLIDKNNIVQALWVYNTSIGREIDEISRVLDAMIFVEEHGKLCPVNWKKGQEGINANKDDLKNWIKKNTGAK